MSKLDTLTFSSCCWGSLAWAYLGDFTQGQLIESYRAWFLPQVYTYLSTSVLIAFLAIAAQRMFLVSDTYTRLSTAVNIMSIVYLFDEKQVLRVCFL